MQSIETTMYTLKIDESIHDLTNAQRIDIAIQFLHDYPSEQPTTAARIYHAMIICFFHDLNAHKKGIGSLFNIEAVISCTQMSK